jgi:hypothetical protein
MFKFAFPRLNVSIFVNNIVPFIKIVKLVRVFGNLFANCLLQWELAGLNGEPAEPLIYRDFSTKRLEINSFKVSRPPITKLKSSCKNN